MTFEADKREIRKESVYERERVREKIMDDLELRVFKKKRSIFVENVEMNCTFLDSIKSHEIFNSEECTLIMVCLEKILVVFKISVT